LIYRSTNGGTSWQPISVGTVVEGFRAIAVSPANPGYVYAYSTDSSFGGQGTVYRSIDDGLSWKPLPNQPSSAVTGSFFAGVGRGIAIDPTGRILVLTDEYSGILRSSDAGKTWTNPLPNAGAFGLTAVPSQPGVLWAAGLDYTTGLASVWKSKDFGVTWSTQAPAAFNSPQAVEPQGYAITVQPGTGKIFANWFGFNADFTMLTGGVVVSSDGGRTWAARNNGLLASYSPGLSSGSVAFDPMRPATIYLSTNGVATLDGGGFYRSYDSGETWEPVGFGLRTLGSLGVWVRSAADGYPPAIFAGYPDLFISTDHAATWARTDRGLNNGFAQSIVDDELSSCGYYAASGDGLFHSTDGGEHWGRINTWNGPDAVSRVAVDRKSAARTIYAASVNRVWRSSDAGESWDDVTPQAAPDTLFPLVYSNPNRADDLFAVSDGPLFHSTDRGKTWSRTHCGTVGEGVSSNALVSRTHQGRLYIGRPSGLWISNNDGASCTLSPVQPLPGGTIYSIIEAGTNPAALLISGYPGPSAPVVMRSIDGGASYQTVATLQAFADTPPWELSSAPDLRVAVAVYLDGNIAVSRDGGATWTAQPPTLFSESIGPSFLSATLGKVFFGDISGAVYAAPYEGLH
jgi:photosystem II stability/assembly factor-like uncharacterized protein